MDQNRKKNDRRNLKKLFQDPERDLNAQYRGFEEIQETPHESQAELLRISSEISRLEEEKEKYLNIPEPVRDSEGLEKVEKTLEALGKALHKTGEQIATQQHQLKGARHHLSNAANDFKAMTFHMPSKKREKIWNQATLQIIDRFAA